MKRLFWWGLRRLCLALGMKPVEVLLTVPPPWDYPYGESQHVIRFLVRRRRWATEEDATAERARVWFGYKRMLREQHGIETTLGPRIGEGTCG